MIEIHVWPVSVRTAELPQHSHQKPRLLFGDGIEVANILNTTWHASPNGIINEVEKNQIRIEKYLGFYPTIYILSWQRNTDKKNRAS